MKVYLVAILGSAVALTDSLAEDCDPKHLEAGGDKSLYHYCDRDSECCGTATPWTVTENPNQVNVSTTKRLCQRKDKTTVQVGTDVYNFKCGKAAFLQAGIAAAAAIAVTLY